MKAASKQIVAIFQNYYPELLQVKFFINVPPVMETLMGLFAPFIGKNTRKKFRMIGPNGARAALLQVICPSNLPARYGGYLKLLSSVGEMTSFMESCVVPCRKSITISKDFGINGCCISYQIIVHSYDINVTIPAKNRQITYDRVNILRGEYQLDPSESCFSLVLDNSFSLVRDKTVDYMFTVKKKLL